MNNGIFLNYLLSFPVTFEQPICDKVIESFRRGIKKSLPDSILHNGGIMKHSRVVKGISEPAAYAICALEQYHFDLEDDTKEVYYGIFDFGGGTTDFDFGHSHLPLEQESRRYDYVLECYGSGGDQYLGGENLLQLMAFEVFRLNQNKLREDGITFVASTGMPSRSGKRIVAFYFTGSKVKHTPVDGKTPSLLGNAKTITILYINPAKLSFLCLHVQESKS